MRRLPPCRTTHGTTLFRRHQLSCFSANYSMLKVDTAVLTEISPRAASTTRAFRGTSPSHLESSKDGSRTLYSRRAHRALPLPPVLDPHVIARRRAITPPRPLQCWDKVSPFQQSLAGNAFAQILATPLRRDSITQTLLPRFFLQAYGTTFKTPAAGTKTIRQRAPRDNLAPHVAAVRWDDTRSVSPRAYALSGARIELLQRIWGVVGMRQEHRYGLGRDRWCVDMDAVKAQSEELVYRKVEGQLVRLIRQGLLDGKGVTVLLDPKQQCAELSRSSYNFVLPPRLARKIWTRSLGHVLEFSMDERTVGAVVALLEMDLFYRSTAKGGYNEILQLWNKNETS